MHLAFGRALPMLLNCRLYWIVLVGRTSWTQWWSINTSTSQSLRELKSPFSVLQLSPDFSQETTCQQAAVHKKKETPGDAGHAAATEEVEPGHRGDVQGGPSSPAPAEPAPGPVSAAAGAYDEPSGEDDPVSLHHISIIGPEWGQRSREAMKCEGYRCRGCLVFYGFHYIVNLCGISQSIDQWYREVQKHAVSVSDGVVSLNTCHQRWQCLEDVCWHFNIYHIRGCSLSFLTD